MGFLWVPQFTPGHRLFLLAKAAISVGVWAGGASAGAVEQSWGVWGRAEDSPRREKALEGLLLQEIFLISTSPHPKQTPHSSANDYGHAHLVLSPLDSCSCPRSFQSHCSAAWTEPPNLFLLGLGFGLHLAVLRLVIPVLFSGMNDSWKCWGRGTRWGARD